MTFQSGTFPIHEEGWPPAQLDPLPPSPPRPQYGDVPTSTLRTAAEVRRWPAMSGMIAAIPDVTPGIGPDMTPWPLYSPTMTTELAPGTWEPEDCQCP